MFAFEYAQILSAFRSCGVPDSTSCGTKARFMGAIQIFAVGKELVAKFLARSSREPRICNSRPNCASDRLTFNLRRSVYLSEPDTRRRSREFDSKVDRG